VYGARKHPAYDGVCVSVYVLLLSIDIHLVFYLAENEENKWSFHCFARIFFTSALTTFFRQGLLKYKHVSIFIYYIYICVCMYNEDQLYKRKWKMIRYVRMRFNIFKNIYALNKRKKNDFSHGKICYNWWTMMSIVVIIIAIKLCVIYGCMRPGTISILLFLSSS
jgi:hypothetical protein